MFRIGDFSRLARVTVKTLHHYDEAGLLTPNHVDPFTGYRYYGAEQLETLQRILALKDVGFSLEEVRRLMDPSLSEPALQERLEERRAELTRQIESEQHRLRRLDALRDALSGADASRTPAVALRTIEPIEVHSERMRVPALGAPVQALFESAERTVARVKARASASPFLIFHDAEHRDTEADVEACIPVKRASEGSIRTRTVPGGAMGCVTYRGPYEQTPLLYAAMLSWIERSGLTLAGPLREVYHRFGADQRGYRLPQHVLVNDAEEFVTELQAPVEPRDAATRRNQQGDNP